MFFHHVESMKAVKSSSIKVKARRDTYGATGHAHINIVSFVSHCTTIITIFVLLQGVGLDLGQV